jgi:hypothetical protein
VKDLHIEYKTDVFDKRDDKKRPSVSWQHIAHLEGNTKTNTSLDSHVYGRYRDTHMVTNLFHLIVRAFAALPTSLGSKWLGLVFPFIVFVLTHIIAGFVRGWP